MAITRANGRGYKYPRYIGACDECGETTPVSMFRTTIQDRLAAHYRATGHQPKGLPVKTPSTELPKYDDRLADFVDHLIVVSNARRTKRDTSFGNRECVEGEVWIFHEGEWKGLPDAPIYWKVVCDQIMEAMPEEIGGILTQGTERNPREWCLKPVPRTNKALTAALAGWEKASKDAASF